MRIQILTIFPELFGPFLETALLGRARERGLLSVEVRDLRDWSADRHRSVDDEPFGGGGGMVMTAPPWLAAVRALSAGAAPWRILMSPQGRRLDEAAVRELAGREDLLLLCGRYEGVDERVRQTVVDEEISVGDFVVSGGELPALMLIDAVSRLLPGTLGCAESAEQESFANGLLDWPHYTRPEVWQGRDVPAVLLSGNHAAIGRWRLKQALGRTWQRRPELLQERELSVEERRLLEEYQAEQDAPRHGS